MSGHRITPYELSATKKFARGENKEGKLLLASIGKEGTVDLLDTVDEQLPQVEPITRDDSWSFSFVCQRRDTNSITMVFANDISGEREVVHDGAAEGRPVVFVKNREHVTRFYSLCMLWRPPAGDLGLLLVHSPWGRSGGRTSIVRLLQKAVDLVPDSAAKLQAHPMIPAKELERLIRQANATRITYTKTKRIVSAFADNTQTTATVAEMDLVVKGSDSIPYRDALKSALRASANRDKFFTVQLRNDGDPHGYRTEKFDDVAVDFETAGGVKRYSMREDTIPTVSFDETSALNAVYYGLREDAKDKWADQILDAGEPILARLTREVMQ